MALIAVTVEPNVARIFFDMGPTEYPRDDERRIAAVIERAFAETDEAEDTQPSYAVRTLRTG
jgi:hypothetical protein